MLMLMLPLRRLLINKFITPHSVLRALEEVVTDLYFVAVEGTAVLGCGENMAKDNDEDDEHDEDELGLGVDGLKNGRERSD